MQTKTCTKCGEEKALTEFYKHKRGKYGVDSQCKECIRELGREYKRRPEVRERNREYQREYYQRPEVREHKREFYQRPEVRERKRKYMSEYHQRPEVRERKRKYMSEYHQRPEVREHKRERIRAASGMGLDYTSHLEITAKYATRSGTPWSDAEVKFLMTSDLPLVDIALELGRSYNSVYLKRTRLRK